MLILPFSWFMTFSKPVVEEQWEDSSYHRLKTSIFFRHNIAVYLSLRPQIQACIGSWMQFRCYGLWPSKLPLSLFIFVNLSKKLSKAQTCNVAWKRLFRPLCLDLGLYLCSRLILLFLDPLLPRSSAQPLFSMKVRRFGAGQERNAWQNAIL